MKKIILFAAITTTIFINSASAQEGWYSIFSVQGTVYFSGINFFNGNAAYLSMRYGNGHYNGGQISKSTNGGVNWSPVFSGVPINSIYFIDLNTGWAAGGYWDDAGKRSREVFRTTNGGINFVRTYIDSVNSTFGKIFFTDVGTGWIMTTTNEFLKTTNSGYNWFHCSSVFYGHYYFINNTTGWRTSSDSVYKTTNGGVNWYLQLSSAGTAFGEVFFININTGWVTGSTNIYRSSNGGENWISHSTGLATSVYSIEFINAATGWASGNNGKIIRTTNGGINWIQQNSGVNFSLPLLCFADANTGFAGGFRTIDPYTIESRLLKTTTGGITYLQNISSQHPDNFSLSQNYPNPFNPITKIRFDVAPDSRLRGNDNVTLIIYDILGREITTLVNEQLKPGTYEVEWEVSNYPSGVYFYKLQTSEFNETKKMVLVK